MKTLSKMILLCALVIGGTYPVIAAETQKPVIQKYTFDDSGILNALSENGEWALVTFGTSDLAEMGKHKIVNVLTGEFENIQTDEEITLYGKQTVNDITNDGQTIVGAFKGEPAYWSKQTRQWTTLPTPSGCSSAVITQITPDGKYAIGRGLKASNEYYIEGAMWDITTGQIVILSNLPVLDMSHEDQDQLQLISISDDGRYVLGSLSYSYLQPVAPCVFLYDRQNSSYKFIGFDPSDTEDWKPWVEGLAFLDEGKISGNGKYITCHAWMYTEGAAGSSIAEVDGDAVAYYEVESGKFAILEGSNDMLTTAVDNNGTVYAGTPAGNPLREWAVFHNGYWYPISLILEQQYGIDFYNATNYGNTGTVSDISGDCKTMTVMVEPTGESYTISLPNAPASVCDNIKLLGNYSITPADGMSFTKLRSVEITFDREVEFIGNDVKTATLTKSDGTLVRNSSGIAVSTISKKTIIVTFRPQTLAQDETYTVTVPAGIISIAGDATKTNGEITVSYNGRADVAVAPVNIYPIDGSTLSKIDNASNPIVVTFDAQLVLTDNAAAQLYLVDGENIDKVCDLSTYTSESHLFVYPTNAQYLYLDKQYRVVIAKGCVTDYSGSGENEEIVLNYTGSYERPISHDSANLFIDDFSNQAQSLINFMRYEGDHLTPTKEMQSLGFDADNQPWNFSIHESETSSDYCAASTSMYSPAGQSDDWLVIPPLEIPDEYVSLTFKAQSYKLDKKDYLKVLVWECDENIGVLTDEIIARIKAEAKVVFNKKLSPGVSEEALSGEWGEYSVDLAEYSGKKIYIAFLNENNNQSMVFVDNIAVTREMKFFISLANEESVVNRDNINILGTLTANAEGETFTSVALTLKDADGNQIDRITADGLSLSKGDKYSFAFNNPFPLTKGIANKCIIAVEMGNYSDNVVSTIKNLTFEPVKRVILEEYTGITCGNCPKGILAIEHLREIYGDLFIPISIHAYRGDPFESGLTSYATFIGLYAAPSGMVQRNGIISYPIGEDLNTGAWTFSNGTTLWKDIIAAEFEVPADAEISAKYVIDETAGTFDLPVTIKYALEASNLNLNIFIVMLEDKIKSYQDNYLSGNSEPILGDWGVGGKYGQPVVYDYVHYDIARACWGTSYNGTAGLLPQSVIAGKDYTAELTGFEIPEEISNINNTKMVVMLIDGNTDKLINAVCVKASGYDDAVEGINNDSNCNITTYDNNVMITATGDITANIYTTTGMLIDSATGNGHITIPVAQYDGVAIVRTVVNGEIVVKKILINNK